jgi:hypothetical protein
MNHYKAKNVEYNLVIANIINIQIYTIHLCVTNKTYVINTKKLQMPVSSGNFHAKLGLYQESLAFLNITRQ